MTTFGADGNGVASIVLVMKTGSIRAKSDLLREPELRWWSPHTLNGFNHIGVSARLILSPHRGDVLRSDDISSRDDVLGNPIVITGLACAGDPSSSKQLFTKIDGCPDQVRA
jgi:hypothetical protein